MNIEARSLSHEGKDQHISSAVTTRLLTALNHRQLTFAMRSAPHILSNTWASPSYHVLPWELPNSRWSENRTLKYQHWWVYSDDGSLSTADECKGKREVARGEIEALTRGGNKYKRFDPSHIATTISSHHLIISSSQSSQDRSRIKSSSQIKMRFTAIVRLTPTLLYRTDFYQILATMAFAFAQHVVADCSGGLGANANQCYELLSGECAALTDDIDATTECLDGAAETCAKDCWEGRDVTELDWRKAWKRRERWDYWSCMRFGSEDRWSMLLNHRFAFNLNGFQGCIFPTTRNEVWDCTRGLESGTVIIFGMARVKLINFVSDLQSKNIWIEVYQVHHQVIHNPFLLYVPKPLWMRLLPQYGSRPGTRASPLSVEVWW